MAADHARIQTVKVEDIPQGSVKYGICMWDKRKEQWFAHDETPWPDNPAQLLERILREDDETANDILYASRYDGTGIVINETTFLWADGLGAVFDQLIDPEEVDGAG